MYRNDGVSFTSSPHKIPLLSPNFSLSQTLASQLAGTRHLAFQLIDSLKNRSHYVKHHSTHSTLSTQSELESRSIIKKSPLFCSSSLSLTSEKHSIIGTSPLLHSASLSLTKPDSTESTQNGFNEEKVLVGEVLVRNKDGEELERKDLEMEALNALKACRADSALTALEVQEDVDRIIDSGYFSSCTPVAVDSRDGIKLVFQVEPNQEFHGLICEGANVLPSKFLENSFRDGHGKVVNFKRLDEVISSINGWYMDRGLFGLVSGVDILSGGVIRLKIAEAEVNDISVRFLDRKTGEPTKGKTKPETILRELATKKGQVYSTLQGKGDVDTLGLTADISILPQPAGDAGNVDLIVSVVERPSGRFSAGAGISSRITSDPLSGLFGSFAYSEKNLFGKNQKVNVSLETGQTDSTFRINYTDPWIEGNDKRTSRTITAQNSKTSGTLVHGNQQDNSSLSIGRLTAGVEFSRPLRPKWSGMAGLFFQHAGARDEKGNPIIKDSYGSPLTASGKPYDDVLLAKFESIYTGSGNKGSSMFTINMEQGLPVMSDWLCFNRVNARASKGVKLGPARLLLRFSGGHVVGNFPPHEAYAIGGTNSVRGYKEGAVGSGRSFVVGTSEVSLKVLGPVQGVIFADYGHDLWSGPNVLGNPAGARKKRGSGYGYGIGIRMDSPFGFLRLEFAFNDRLSKRLHFALGHPK